MVPHFDHFDLFLFKGQSCSISDLKISGGDSRSVNPRSKGVKLNVV